MIRVYMEWYCDVASCGVTTKKELDTPVDGAWIKINTPPTWRDICPIHVINNVEEDVEPKS